MTDFAQFKKENQIKEKIWFNIRKTNRKCFKNGCNDLAIRSHYQQENGVLNELAKDKIVWGLGVMPKAKRGYDKNNGYEFIQKPISHKGELTTFCGFCNKHDSHIFDKIENSKYKPFNYRSREIQLLHAYRGVCNELHKQEFNIKATKSLLSNPKIKLLKNHCFIEDLTCNMKVRMTRFVKKQIEDDLYNHTDNFIFEHFTLPRIDICTTSLLGTIPEFDNINISRWLNIIDNHEVIEGIGATNFLILIPENEILNVIIGTNKKRLFENLDLEKIINKTIDEKLVFLSDIIIREIETWVMSNKLYLEWKKIGWDKKVIEEINRHKPFTTVLKPTNLNIFKPNQQ